MKAAERIRLCRSVVYGGAAVPAGMKEERYAEST